MKKTKNISKSCVNLSFSQELDDLRNSKEKFKNTIPSTPSASSIQDLFNSDPRRSSTPLNRKWNRRTSSNAWSKPPNSPLGSSLSYQQSQSATNISRSAHSPISDFKKPFPDTQELKKTDNVIRRAGGGRRRARPKSMLIQPVAVRAQDSEIAIARADLRKQQQSHSDTELEESTIENSVFANSTVTSPTSRPKLTMDRRSASMSTPTRYSGNREIDIDEQFHESVIPNGEWSESEVERVRRVAHEIDENVRQLQQQQQTQEQLSQHEQHLQQPQQNLNSSRENIDEEELRHTKELIRLYETGSISCHGKVISSSPPERDVPTDLQVFFVIYV